MAEYAYVAVMQNGKEKKGSLEAKDEDRVRVMLRAEGLIPISVKAQSLLTRDINLSIGKAVKVRDLSVFCRQFASILNAGVTVVQALNMLSEQSENKVFAQAIKDTRMGVEKGSSLGDAMRACKKIYPSILINMVDAGEASGSLDIAFERMATHFEKSAKLQGLVKKAMIYPVVLIIVTIAVAIIMSVAVVPKFADMFASMGAELPTLTKIVVAFSNFLIYKWYLVIGIVVAIVVAVKVFKATDMGKTVLGTIAIKMPIFGKLSVKSASASMARTLSTLISTGISISTALEITARSMTNILYKRALEKARTEVEQGISLSEPLKKCGVFPPMVYHMTSIGEETGNVEHMLDKVAEYYEDEVEITTQSLTALMEPLIIIVMAGIVAVLVLAIYQPMISMYGNLNNL